MIRPFLILALLFIVGFAHAQDALTGRVYEDKTINAIPGIVIRNLKSNQTTVSDRTGGFMISAKQGDLIIFAGMSYVTDTLYVTNMKYTEIRLIPKSRLLGEVKVTGAEVKTGSLKDTRPLGPLDGQTVVYQTNDAGDFSGGLAVNIFDSHSAAKKRARTAKITADEGTKEQIDSVFSTGNLQKYIPLTGQELQNYIILYRPDVEAFRDPGFNLALYLNKCYKKFLEIPVDKRRSKELTGIFTDTTTNKPVKQQ